MDGPQCEALLTDGKQCLTKHFSSQDHRNHLELFRVWNPTPQEIVNTVNKTVNTKTEKTSPVLTKKSRKEYMRDYMRHHRLAGKNVSEATNL